MAEISRRADISELSTAHRRRTITITMLATCMLFGIDQSMISVALPSIRDGLSLQNDQLSWIASSYVIAFMAVSPGVRWLCVRFGRRAVFCAAVAIMATANALSASATSIQALVTLRIVLGATMGVTFPLTLSNLLDEHTHETFPQTIALWTTAGWIGPIAGTALAGILVHRFGWPSIYVVQAAICAIMAAASLKWTRRREQQASQKLDVIGLATLVLAIVAFQLLLVQGFGGSGTTSSSILIVVLVCCSLVFFRNLRGNAHSIVNPKLFVDNNFTFSSAMLIVLGFEIFALSFVIPLVLADIVRADAFQISLFALPRMIGTAFGAAIAARLDGAFGSERLVAGSFALIGIGSVLMLVVVATADPTAVVVAGTLVGLGVGIASTALGIIAFATLPVEWRDEGAALRQLLRIVGGTVGISIVVAVTSRPTNTGVGNYSDGFVVTALVGLFGLAIVLLRLILARDRRQRDSGTMPENNPR